MKIVAFFLVMSVIAFFCNLYIVAYGTPLAINVAAVVVNFVSIALLGTLLLRGK